MVVLAAAMAPRQVFLVLLLTAAAAVGRIEAVLVGMVLAEVDLLGNIPTIYQ